MKYNHAVDIAFSLVSNHPQGEDITADMLRTALWNRIRDLDDSNEWGEIAANTVPFDTYEVEAEEFVSDQENSHGTMIIKKVKD